MRRFKVLFLMAAATSCVAAAGDAVEEGGGGDDDKEGGCVPSRGKFFCLGQCLEADRLCDGVEDCLDGSDEGPRCSADACASAGCHQECLDAPGGPACYCRPGYELGLSGLCTDLDECAGFGICSQLCSNTPGSFSCSCADGFFYRDAFGAGGSGAMCHPSDPGKTRLFYATKEQVNTRLHFFKL